MLSSSEENRPRKSSFMHLVLLYPAKFKNGRGPTRENTQHSKRHEKLFCILLHIISDLISGYIWKVYSKEAQAKLPEKSFPKWTGHSLTCGRPSSPCARRGPRGGSSSPTRC